MMGALPQAQWGRAGQTEHRRPRIILLNVHQIKLHKRPVWTELIQIENGLAYAGKLLCFEKKISTIVPRLFHDCVQYVPWGCMRAPRCHNDQRLLDYPTDYFYGFLCM
eukprot:scaffold131595_cov53-Attheya_sp.AAC.7